MAQNLWRGIGAAIMFIVGQPVQVLPKCVMYGFCNRMDSGLSQQCVYDGPPKILNNASSLEFLKKYCTDLYNPEGDTLTCCNSEQLVTMEKQMHQLEIVFRRCPSCIENMYKMICYSTCDPNQSDYVQLGEVQINDQTLERYVTYAILYFSSHYLDGAYQSCSHVALPSMGKLAIDASCGRYTSATCNADRWFEFFGDTSQNPVAPMKVKFVRQDTPFLSYTPFDVIIHKCNESPKNGSSPCSCLDCLESCPPLQRYSSSELDFFIFGLDGIVFIVICLYILFMTVFLVVKWIFIRRKHRELNTTSVSGGQPKKVRFNTFNNRIEEKLEGVFFSCGKAVANHPTLVLSVCSWFIGICSYGLQYLVITSNPVEIWSSPSSQARIEKDYFESKFQPFFRTEQIFLKAVNLPKIQHNTSTGTIEFGPAFHKDFLLTVFDLQEKIENIPGFMDICFAPLSHNGVKAESKSQCTVESIYGYFSNNRNKFNESSTDDSNHTVNYLDHTYKCLQSSVNEDCLAPYGGNVEPALAVGGFLKYGKEAYEKADAIVLTFIVNNNLNEDEVKPALEWENRFIDFLLKWSEKDKPSYMDVSFRAEISIQQEIAKESNAEVITIVISYLCMFIYISVSLGSFHSWSSLFINSKILLGLGGIVVVMASVSSSIGIFGYIGTPTTLLTMEVIPFLLLAVGVDNMFLIVNTCNRIMNESMGVPLCVAEALKHIGPSLLLTTLSEAACFAIGALSDMPAVRTFALYAMVAIIINFFLQLTVFLAFLTLDLKRAKERKFDVFFCFSGSVSDQERKHSWIENVLKKYIVPVIFKTFIKEVICLVFITYFFLSLALLHSIEPGLDQRISMPENSYLNKYFLMMDEVLSMGPNMYFVLKPGLNFSYEKDQNLICGALRCNSDSLSTQIYAASKQSDITYIRTSASSWLDDYFDWSTVQGCCKIYPNGTFCPHSDADCIACPIVSNTDGMRPDPLSFKKFLPNFLLDVPDIQCAKAGHAAYGQAVKYEYDIAGNAEVLDTYFMAYHTTLKTSKDYYTALSIARNIAVNITKMLNNNRDVGKEVEVFPYSIFYVFYEQYLTIWETMILGLCYSFAAIFIVTFILTIFDLVSSIIVLLNVIMIVVDLAALMFLWDINLNAITLVNLIVAAGISVEFCSHIVHSFSASTHPTRKLRAQEALIKTGSSVIAGIMLTKILGIIVLAFSKTQIFRVFYFRMYLGMVLFGAAHGLIFLPLLMSYIGPNNNKRLLQKQNRHREVLEEIE